MKKNLIKALARLASLAYQDAYIVHGTPDWYATPEDIIENVASLCQLAGKSPYREYFDAAQHEKLAVLQREIKKLGTEFWDGANPPSAGQLVHENQLWAELRSLSADCLKSFGIDVSGMSPEEIDG